jgi:hypothetical protein
MLIVPAREMEEVEIHEIEEIMNCISLIAVNELIGPLC